MDEPDFVGWATVANVKCSDGRTIAPDAFKHQDKVRVPLVWQHTHNDPMNVLGYADLEHRDRGVLASAYFNDTERGVATKKIVQHGDVDSLSIFANRLVEKGGTVLHGMIREVSLVLAGANSEARIVNVRMAHSDDPNEFDVYDDEAVIFNGTPLEHIHKDETVVETPEEVSTEEPKEEEAQVEHAEENSGDERTLKDILDTLTDDQKTVVNYMLTVAAGFSEAKHGDDFDNYVVENTTSPAKDILSGMSEEQSNLVHFMLASADEMKGAENLENVNDETAVHADDTQKGNPMTNVFEQNGAGENAGGTKTLSHADQAKIFKNARRLGSLKAAVEEYSEASLSHGVEDIEILFPDAKAVNNTPEFLKRRTEWVAKVLDGTKHTPFSRIKSLTANLTLSEARAKGYIKGNVKKEEFFRVSKRVTTPQTVYKKQKLDRDDILDITDFDMVAWLKGEMRLMLEEEIARAILIGDGRSNGDEDKISEENIRPISNDADLFVTKLYVNLKDANSSAEELVDALVLNRRYYRGTGNPTMFTSETLLAKLLSVKDTTGRRIYNTPVDLLAVLRVESIVTVELLDEPQVDVLAILVNLNDYNVGTDKGGAVTMFDDFDIDYNQYKYLIETRVSGALVKAKAALVVKQTSASSTLVDPVAPTWNGTNHTVTVATTTGITYKNRDTNATLTTGSPVTLSEGEELVVIAVPNNGYHLASNTADEFLFDYDRGRVDPAF